MVKMKVFFIFFIVFLSDHVQTLQSVSEIVKVKYIFFKVTNSPCGQHSKGGRERERVG